VGKATGSSLQVAVPGGGPGDSVVDENGLDDVAFVDEATPLTGFDLGRRRFTFAALVAMGVTAIPFIWILWSEWSSATLFRQAVYEDNFFDLQARAMFHGHLSLPNGALGLEGFVHDGRTYTYFGLFGSIIRMPILLITSSLDGKLTTLSILVAWLLTGLFVALLLWKVRFLLRGDVAMGRIEATGYGIVMATIMGGSVWMVLAAIPYVFGEDIAWSICLTVGSILALLGVIERPSWGRVIASGVLILCASLDRATTGWACVLGACLIAVWFFLGRGGPENRRWCIPIFLAGVIPLVIGCAVNYAKFGVPFNVPITEQVWSQVNGYRRQFLAANHNSEVGTAFIPTDLLTYLRPDSLSFSNVFPYITLPTSPPTAAGGVLFDKLYRTSSVPASMPLLFLLSLWGLVTAFRPRALGEVARTRLLLVAAAGAAAALLLWGYIAPRYLGDFMPILVLASAVGVADVFRRLEGRQRSMQIGATGFIAVAAVFSIVANVGIAIVPNEEWDASQLLSYVQTQKTLSDLTGHPLNARVIRGHSLPAWGPAGQLYVIGNCGGLYVSNGEKYSSYPSFQYHRDTWMTVQLGQPFQHAFELAVPALQPGQTESIALVSAGDLTVKASATRLRANRTLLTFGTYRSGKNVKSASLVVNAGKTQNVLVTTDPVKHEVNVDVNGTTYDLVDDASVTLVDLAPFNLAKGQTIRVDAPSAGTSGAQAGLRAVSVPISPPTLCQSLDH
jgi:hypothetical protein